MATSTITSGYLYAIQGNTTYYNGPTSSTPSWATNREGDDTYYVGHHWYSDYNAVAVEYLVPSISDSLRGRTITLNAHLYHTDGVSKVSAVLSTQEPTHLGFRFGPTSGVISNVATVDPENLGGATDTISLSFTITDGILITGKVIYLYLYEDTDGSDPNAPLNSVTTYKFDDATLTYTTAYTLSISAGTGSTITVSRTSSSVSTGTLQNGAALYYGDKLKITFTPSTNYMIKSGTVNGSNFTSGNTHSVTDNVSVVAVAQVLASDIGATDANIGSTSTITITKYNSGYYHTVQYSFGALSGYITSNGSVSTSESKFSGASIAFVIPVAFYAQIPNAKTGKCTLTCRTYSSATSTTQLGDATTCQFTVTAANSSPTVTGAVTDINQVTIALTGDPTQLIRYKSTAQCEISATPKNSASIKSVSIDGVVISGSSDSTGVVTATKTYQEVSKSSFAFSAVDSRGYSSSTTVSPKMIAYVVLTCNPVIYRPTTTGDEVVMEVSGNFYNGSFGATRNTLSLRYRYREVGGTYSSWITVDSTKIITGTSSYRSNGTISLGTGFAYNKDYEFVVVATDGTSEYTLSTTSSTPIPVRRGIPVFDWGENDFNVNVDLMLKNINILDIIYPIGAVYMHSASTIPEIIAGIGSWTSVSTGVSGVYAWKRTQ